MPTAPLRHIDTPDDLADPPSIVALVDDAGTYASMLHPVEVLTMYADGTRETQRPSKAAGGDIDGDTLAHADRILASLDLVRIGPWRP